MEIFPTITGQPLQGRDPTAAKNAYIKYLDTSPEPFISKASLKPTKLVQLKTSRLLIREFTLDDYEGAHAYGSDPEVTRYMEWGPNTPEDTRSFLARAVEHQSENPRLSYTLAIEHPEHGVIGGCGVYVTSLQNRNASIGYCLNRSHWGQGYATEVAGKLIAYGFEALNMHRITATCDPSNVASWRVMEHNSMTREGHLREDKLMRGEWRDSLIYSILRHEYGPNGSSR